MERQTELRDRTDKLVLTILIVLLAPALLYHKQPARASKDPIGLCLLLAGSLWYKGSWLPCTKWIYYRRPYVLKNHESASKKPLLGLVLYDYYWRLQLLGTLLDFCSEELREG